MCEALKLHINNCLCLLIIKIKSLLKLKLSILSIFRRLNNLDNFINVIDCSNQSFQNVHSVLSNFQIINCAAGYNFVAVIYKVLNQLLQSQNFRLKICCRQCKHARFIITRSSTLFYLRNKGKVYYAKVRLQICFCKKLIQNNLCDCTFFQINYKTHT